MCPSIILFTIKKRDKFQLGSVKRIWYLSPMQAAKVQASLRIRLVSPEPPLLAHTSSESRGTFRQKARSLAPLNGWACAVKTCHDGMLEDTNSLDAAQFIYMYSFEKTSLRFSIEDRVIYQACPCTCSDHMGISGSTCTVRSLYVGPINVFFLHIK